jgi:ubiquinone/menaquinone biosynthesis C-methylase UbiE
MTTIPEFCCPQCNRSLQLRTNAYQCLPCAKTFPIVFGIPDFRLFIGPYASDEHTYKEDDYRHVMSLVERFEQEDFAELLRRYLLAADVSGDRFTRMYRNILAMTERGVDNLQEIERLSHSHHLHKFASVLEVGCGAGSFLIAARRKVEQVVGVDMAMRWLVLAKKQLAELKLDLPLVCCYAEYLPFKDNSFDLIVAEDVLEHVQQQDRMLRESHRVMCGDGVLSLKIPNRFSLTPEPHVRVWGVGFLPRPLMSPYVEWLTGNPYRHVRLTSFLETKRLLRASGFDDNDFSIPPISEYELLGSSRFRQVGATVYHLIRRVPVFRTLLYYIGPFFHVLAYPAKGQPPTAATGSRSRG